MKRADRLAWLDLTALVVEPHWLDRARCGDMDPDVFFPPDGFGGDSSYNAAIAHCGLCPVRYSCLAANLGEVHGCFGGTTPGDRRRIRRMVVERGAA